MAPNVTTPKATLTVDKDTKGQEKPDKEQPDEQPVKEMSEKDKLEQLQKQNAQRLFNKITGIKTLTKEAVEAIEDDLKGRKLSKKYRQEVNKWLRDAYAQLEKEKNKSKRDNRGKKAKPVSIVEIRKDTKELAIKLQAYKEQQAKDGKSVTRILNAKNTLQRLLKYQLTE